MRSYKFTPEACRNLFAIDCGLYRKQANGAHKQVTSLHNGQLVVTVDGEMVHGRDIAWCLHYGNWPKFHLVHLNGDLHDLDISNILPARVKILRYIQTNIAHLYKHNRSKLQFDTPQACREHWISTARAFYEKDLPRVLQIEREERELRLATLEIVQEPAVKTVLREPPKKPGRKPRPTAIPPKIPGRVWHWYDSEWLSVPEPCHVADDNKERCRLVKAGFDRFEFDAKTQTVLAIKPLASQPGSDSLRQQVIASQIN